MSYTPNTWKSGDVVTSAKLNNIENGIASAVLKANISIDEQTGIATLDKTWQEILDANYAVIVVPHGSNEGFDFVMVASIYTMPKDGGGTAYSVTGVAFSPEGSAIVMPLETDSADGYPSMSMG